MWKWFKSQPVAVKWMIILGLLALVGIIHRWEYVSKEAGEAFRSRIERMRFEKGIPHRGSTNEI